MENNSKTISKLPFPLRDYQSAGVNFLVTRKNILLADEIVSELDHVTAREIMDLIAEAQKRTNLTAIMVHHDMKLALEYATRVAVIQNGQKTLEIGVEGDKIVDFQTGDMSTEEIMEAISNDSEK